MSKKDRKDIPIKKLSLHEQGDDKPIPAEEALNMMWRLALDAWAFKENLNAEPRLQRHVVVLKKRGG